MKRLASSIAFFFLGFVSTGTAEEVAPTTVDALNAANDQLPVIASVSVVKKATPVTAARHLRAGDVLHSSDLLSENGNPALADLVGMELKRAIYAGKIVSANDVRRPTLIQRNAIVALEFERGPLMITTEGRALDAGASGERIRIMNLSSKIVLTAEVVGPNKARTR